MLLETIRTYKDKHTGEIYKKGSTRTVEEARGKELIAKNVAIEAEDKKVKKSNKATETPDE